MSKVLRRETDKIEKKSNYEYLCEYRVWQLIYKEYVYSVAVCQKYLTRLGELIILEPLPSKTIISPNLV